MLGCTYSDVKRSLLLNQHLKDIAEGNYDFRQKRKLSKEIQTATQIGKDLLNFDVDMSIAPTMVNSAHIFKTGVGCEPQKRENTKFEAVYKQIRKYTQF